MGEESHALSAALLNDVLSGRTYESVARAHGLTRTAVERRVKGLALCLIRAGAVESLNESQAHFVHKLREQRDAIEAALLGYQPVARFEKQMPQVLSDQHVQTALRRVRLHTSTPDRDAAMVMILLATGLRPLEVARLDVGDYLSPDGAVRAASQVREEVASNRRPRPLFFASEAVCSAIDAYLLHRLANTGRAPEGPYRGLSGRDALFLTEQHRRFRVDVVPTPTGTRSLCQEIHYAYRKIFRRIGYPGLSALTLRHTVMDRLSRRGANEGQIGELLGIRELSSIKRPTLRLEELMDGLI